MITLTLDYPPTTNTYYRHVGSRVLISAKGRGYRQHVAMAVREQAPGIEPLTGNLAIEIYLSPPDNRRRDLDNVDGKALLDALTHAGVWGDDSQIKRRVSEMGGPVPGGCCELKVFQLDTGGHP